jgi:hypothetical protein
MLSSKSRIADMVARRAAAALLSAESERMVDAGMSKLRTEVVVGVAPTERTSLWPWEAECTASATTRRASNSWRRKSSASAREEER